MSDDFADLEIPAFLKVGTPENEALRARPVPPRQAAPPLDLLAPKPMAESTAAFVAEQEANRKTRARNRIARMLIKKEDHTGERWNTRTGQWVPINGAKKMISISVPQRVYGSPHDASRAARSLLGPGAEVTIQPIEGGFTFLAIPAAKAANEGVNTMKMPKTAEGAPGIARQFQIDPNKVYSVKSNASRDAKKAGLDHKTAVVETDDHKGFKIVAAKAASKPAKAAKPAKAPKVAKTKNDAVKAPPKPRAAKADGSKSKREIVADLLQRPEGATRAEILEATGWPAVTVQGQAKASGLTLRQEKKPGEPTRYYGAPAA